MPKSHVKLGPTQQWQQVNRSVRLWGQSWVVLFPMALWACTAANPVPPPAAVTVAKTPQSRELQPKLAASGQPAEAYSLVIHRREKRLEVLDSQGTRLYEASVGIGQGGLKEKQDMADLVTPTGEMTVDLILYKKPTYNQITQENVARFTSDPQFRPLVSQPQGLVQLFQNMNGLDFDGNGNPDQAYGDGYIGLTSETTITGPKMSRFATTPYWFSIALHGTPEPKNIGQANSGGCVHLAPETLKQLIEQRWVQLGTVVKIVD